MQAQLKNVQQIQATKGDPTSLGGIVAGAFAAVLGDGSVVTWGDADAGADSAAVQAQLANHVVIRRWIGL